jgi:hypothetical protein
MRIKYLWPLGVLLIGLFSASCEDDPNDLDYLKDGGAAGSAATAGSGGAAGSSTSAGTGGSEAGAAGH